MNPLLKEALDDATSIAVRVHSLQALTDFEAHAHTGLVYP